MNASRTFDFIVTGAGSAGCAVASRLSESGQHSVLLLEAGPPDRSPWIHIPAGFTQLYTNPRFNWCFESEPVPGLNDRALFQPRGKVLGGTSSINGTVYMRGTARDYDGWRQRGCVGWDWDSVLPMFKRAEQQARGEDAFHGTDGPLKVSDIPYRSDLAKAMVNAALEAGIPANPDFNGAGQEGTGFYQFTTSSQRRWSAARAYLHDAKKRPNLHIETGAHATRVILEGRRAVGVEYRTADGVVSARARADVVVSGGTFGSAQLLQLSGIGPGAHLQDMGIGVHCDSPNVGAHLHDHFNTYLTFRSSLGGSYNDLANSLPRRVAAAARYALSGGGPLSNTGVCAGAFVRSDPRLEAPDLQLNMLLWSADRTVDGVTPHSFSGFMLSPVHLSPEGRGTVRLKSADPFAPPAIQFQFLVSEYDRQAIIHGIRRCREIAAQPALRPYVAEEVYPGPAVDSDDALLADVRERAIANYHPVGTCRMGTGADAVVDPRLRVHGVQGLRVADASIMPQIIGGNTNAPSIMIGEKAAAMILEDHQQ
jgi:choline dehydrogenase